MKEITLEVPEGKRAEWINGVLTLVDESKVGPVIERIKTFKDACNALGNGHPFVTQYCLISSTFKDNPMTKDFIAYLKLRIIVASLNEGWEPQFTTDEYRYFPWFYFYTLSEIDEMNEENKSSMVYRGDYIASANGGISYAYTNSDASHSHMDIGYRLTFRTHELAKYAGKQFIDIYKDFMFGNELYTHN